MRKVLSLCLVPHRSSPGFCLDRTWVLLELLESDRNCEEVLLELIRSNRTCKEGFAGVKLLELSFAGVG